MWTRVLATITNPRTWVLLGIAALIIWVFYILNDRQDTKQELSATRTEVVQTRADLKATQEKQVEINTALDNSQKQVIELQNTSEAIQKEIKEVPHDKTSVSKPVAVAISRLCKFDNPPCR